MKATFSLNLNLLTIPSFSYFSIRDTCHARQIEMESPYEQLDKRRSRSIGSALDAQSMRSIDDKVNAWQKNSTGSSSGTGEEVNGFHDTRSISRQKARTPSLASLASHHVADGNTHSGQAMEPIYYNGLGNGTLRSVRSFMSLATLKSQKKMRPRQIPMPMAPPPPPPVMFATLSKKELKKALKKESTLKRKHKYKDMPGPGPFLAGPNGYPLIYGPPPPLPPHGISPHGMPIYAPLPPPGPGGYYTLDGRKGRMAPPPPPHMMPLENGHGHMLPPVGPAMDEEPIYMPTLSSPNGTLRPVTPHGEPIYFDGRNGRGPMPPHMGPPPMFIQHPQGGLVPCTFVPTLSRKELKELEKQKTLMKKAAKKEAKKMKNGKMVPQADMDLYHSHVQRPPPAFVYPPELEHHHQHDGMPIGIPDDYPQQASFNSGSSGIYKKKGHMNERAFSYSIRQEHRSRSNSLSNLAFENGPPPPPTQGNGVRNGEEQMAPSNHASSVSLKSNETSNRHPYNGDYSHANGNGKVYLNGNGRIPSNASLQGPDREGIDPALLATRMSNLKLNGNGAPPPPPPLPPNGYHYQKTATIKRL